MVIEGSTGTSGAEGAAGPDVVTGAGPGAGARLEHRRRRWAGSLLVLGGVLAAGAFAGSWLSHLTAEQPPAVVVDPLALQEGAVAVTTTSVLDVSMPDVLGLEEGAAREAVADAGIGGQRVRTELRAHVGKPGRVIEQRPTRRTSSPNEVVLVLSSAATVPDLVNREEAAAVGELEALGAQVRVVRAYRPDAVTGSVVGTVPAAGAALSEVVELSIAAPPGELFMDQVKAVDSGCSTGEVGIDGHTFPHGLSCSAGSSPASSAYIVARDINRFRATVGQLDRSDPGRVVHVEVRGDGNVLGAVDLAYGQSSLLDVDITGVLRLELVRSVVPLPPGSPSSSSPTVGFGDAVLIGSPDAVDALAGSQR